MGDFLRTIYQEQASRSNTLGILVIDKDKPVSPVTDNFDTIVMIIVRGSVHPWYVKHYEFKGKTAAVHTIDEKQLEEWFDSSLFRQAVEWIVDGTVIFERDEYVSFLKDRINGFPKIKREKKIAVEFAKLTKGYSESKALYQSKQYLDAYSRVLRSLHYLARLTIIEQGFHPEVVVWSQVRQLDPEIYKLYEELIMSREEIDKRVELILLAMEFVISSRAKTCAIHLLRIMDRKEGYWSFGELMTHQEIKAYASNLSSMMDYLMDKRLIEAVQVEAKGTNIHHRKYKANMECL